ncbi:hypothetical protein [Primorskyibacter flagellatus]
MIGGTSPEMTGIDSSTGGQTCTQAPPAAPTHVLCMSSANADLLTKNADS